jgi:hypothetical protein
MRTWRALSVRQPYAALIVAGWKDVENRTWTPPSNAVGERIVIHASLRPLPTPPIAKGFTSPLLQYHGALLGVVTIAAAHNGAKSPWAEKGCFHWRLTDPVAFTEPIPAQGHLSLWEVPADLARLIPKRLKR